MSIVASFPIARQAQPRSSSKFVTIHQLPDGSWAWRKCNTVYPGSVYLSRERFVSQWDAETAAAVISLCDGCDLRLPNDPTGGWAEITRTFVVEVGA